MITPAYTGSTGATWTCSGAHVVNKAQSPEDSETCLVTGDVWAHVAGDYSSTNDAWGVFPGYGYGEWQSDYYIQSSYGGASVIATSWNLTAVDNGNGTFTLDIVAYYANQTT